MTQLAGLNGKILMSKKDGTLWDKAAVDYFEFSSLTTISTPRLQTKIPTQELPNTKPACQSFTHDDPSYKDCISHNLQHHHTSNLLFSL